jgi:phosphatidate cytidylyltransferase
MTGQRRFRLQGEAAIHRGGIVPAAALAPAPDEKEWTMLQRVLSSLVGLPLLVVCVFWHGGLPFALGIAVLSLAALSEFYGACRKQGLRPLPWLGEATALLFLCGAYAGGPVGSGRWTEGVLTAFLLVGLLGELARKERAPVRELGVTLLGALYAGWLFRYLILLRTQGRALLAPWGGHLAVALPGPLADAGAWVVLLVVCVTWACDTGAFFAGRAFGARKLAPGISPGKTVEGAAGGLICALAMSLVMGWRLLSLDPRLAGALGLMVAVLAPVGDLCESALKRELGIKDFGGLLPGHGGVLDRFDSLLFTAPVVYYVLRMVNG